MADNLAFDVIAKTQPARDELQLLNAQIRATTSEVKKLAAEANKDPLAIPKFKAANLELTKLKQTAGDLNKTINRSTEEVEGFAESLLHAAHGNRGINRLFKEFGNLNGSMENTSEIFGRFVGGFAGGFAALTAFKGFEFVRDTINEVSKALGELKKTAAEIGVKPIALQAAQEVTTGIGEEAEVATKALTGMNEQIEEARKQQAMQPNVAGAPSFGTFFGAGKKPDFSKPAELIGADLSNLPNTRAGGLEGQIIQLKAFQNAVNRFDPTTLNIISKSLFQGVPAESMLKVAPALIKDLEAEIKHLETTQRGATGKALADDERLRISKDKLSKSYSEFTSAVATTLAPAQTAFNEFLSGAIDRWSKQFPKDIEQIGRWSEAVGQFFQSLSTAVDTTIAQIEGAWTGLWDFLTGGAQTAVDTIKSIFDAIGQGASAAWGAITGGGSGNVDAGGGGDIVPAGARGGYVRGPGSATSDSILARLSAGEFVVNSASVRRLGTSFLHGLNGFAAGGLVGVPRFAAGGLVGAAGGGRAVHLHLAGQSFALSGAGNVVDALVGEAQRQQMRSAGVKPSWFAGRAMK